MESEVQVLADTQSEWKQRYRQIKHTHKITRLDLELKVRRLLLLPGCNNCDWHLANGDADCDCVHLCACFPFAFAFAAGCS